MRYFKIYLYTCFFFNMIFLNCMSIIVIVIFVFCFVCLFVCSFWYFGVFFFFCFLIYLMIVALISITRFHKKTTFIICLVHVLILFHSMFKAKVQFIYRVHIMSYNILYECRLYLTTKQESAQRVKLHSFFL